MRLGRMRLGVRARRLLIRRCLLIRVRMRCRPLLVKCSLRLQLAHGMYTSLLRMHLLRMHLIRCRSALLA